MLVTMASRETCTSGCPDGSLDALGSYGPSTDDTTFEAPSPRASRHYGWSEFQAEWRGARGSLTTGKRRYRALPLTGRALVCGLKCQPFPLLDEFGDLVGEAV